MYESFFGFDQEPFNVTPDSEFIYYSEQHKEALAHMLYGVQERKGFILVTGRVGSGKTTLCRAFMKELDDRTSTALVLNSKMTAQEILEAIADDFGLELPADPTTKQIIDRLNEFVLDEYRNGRNVCVIIDESQNLSPGALENLRLLSNLETEKEKLLQIVLVGQPELNTLLNKTELRQLKQRITVRAYLSNLTEEETRRYVTHRIEQARPRQPVEIPDKVFARLYQMSAGNPRAINLIMDHTLLAAYVDETFTLKVDHINRAVDELSQEVEEQEGKDARVLHRVRTRAEEFSLPEWAEPVLKVANQPWVYGSGAAIVTLMLLIGGTWVLGGGNGASEPPAISRDLVERPLLSADTVVTRSAVEEKEAPVEDEEAASSDTTADQPTAVVEAPEEQPAIESTSPTDLSETTSSIERDTVEETTEQPVDTAIEESSTENDTSRWRRSVIRNVLESGENSGLTPFPNPLSVEPLETPSALPGEQTPMLALARYLSLKIKSPDNLPENLPNPPLSEINTSLGLDDVIPESLPGQLQPVESDGAYPRTYGFSAFLEWNPPAESVRTVLFVPYEAQIWDPYNGWQRIDRQSLRRNWTGEGRYLMRAGFDPGQEYVRRDVNASVTEIQRLLNEAGDYGLPLVGRFGPRTEQSIRDFQRSQGLRTDGIAGPQTNLVLLRAAGYSNRWSPDEYAQFIRKVEADVVLD